VASVLAAFALPLGLLGGQESTFPDSSLPDSALTRHSVDRSASHLYVVTYRAGLLSFLGHDHAIIPMEWTGELCAHHTLHSGSHGSVRIRTSSLVIDSDSARSLAGLGDGPSEDDVEDIQKTLLDEDHLAAGQHPEIRVESILLSNGETGEIRLRTEVTVRGVTREFDHAVEADVAEDGGMLISGVLPLPQTQFGIRPASVLGVVRVADEVELHFKLVTIPTDEVCGVTGPGGPPEPLPPGAEGFPEKEIWRVD
jgi:hypothetical protein